MTILPPILQRPPDHIVNFFARFDPQGDEMQDFLDTHPETFDRVVQLLSLLTRKPHRVGCFAGAGTSAAYGAPTWKAFLEQAAARLGITDQVAPTLAEWRYEDAAQQLEDHDAQAFESVIRDTFSQSKIKSELRGAGGYLPFIPFDYVVTTNFDYVLDHIYQMAGLILRPVIYGARLEFARAAVDEVLLPLLKVHGDYLFDRILTRGQYERHYSDGSPLAEHLTELFTKVSFLFVGFSMQDERVKRALERARAAGGVQHFAILQAGDRDDMLRRDPELSAIGVLPLWYKGDHVMAERLLGVIAGTCRSDVFAAASAVRRKDGAAALHALEPLLRERPQCHVYRMAYAWSLADSVDWSQCAVDRDYVDRAVRMVDRAIESVEGFADAHALRAMLSHMRFNVTDAIGDATRAIELGCADPEMLVAFRGAVRLLVADDARGAAEDFDQVLRASLVINGQDLSGQIRVGRAMAGIYLAERGAIARLFAEMSNPAVNPGVGTRSTRVLAFLGRPMSAIADWPWMRKSNAWWARRASWFVRGLVMAGRAGLVQAWMRREECKALRRAGTTAPAVSAGNPTTAD